MILERALQQLEAEIERLAQVRSIVAGLGGGGGSRLPSDVAEAPARASKSSLAAMPAGPAAGKASAAAVAQAAVVNVPVRRGRKPRGFDLVRGVTPATARVRRAELPKALGGNIPGKPVAVTAADAARGREVKPVVASKREVAPIGEGTLEALVRELSGRPPFRAS